MTLGGRAERLTLVLAQRQNQVDGLLRFQSTPASDLRGSLQGERLAWTASLLDDCKVEFRGEAAAKAPEIQGRFDVRDCQGRGVQGTFRVTR